MQHQVGFECPADAVSELDIRAWPAGVHAVVLVDPQQQTRAKQRDECRRLELMRRVLHETRDLTRRLATSPAHAAYAGVAKIGRIEFTNTIIGQSRAVLDRTCSGFVANHSKCQLELAAFTRIAIIR